MDFKELKKRLDTKLKHKPPHLTNKEQYEAHKVYLEYHKRHNPDVIYVIPMEEMAELTQHLSKLIRNKESTKDIAVLEEIADVQICLDNLRIAMGIDEDTFKYMIDIKLERSKNRIEKQTN